MKKRRGKHEEMEKKTGISTDRNSSGFTGTSRKKDKESASGPDDTKANRSAEDAVYGEIRCGGTECGDL
jgi:hypothetical protein